MAEVNDEVLEQEIRAIISDVTEIEPEKITREADFVENLGMDSMMALEILAAIEKKYKIRIPEEKLMQLKNLKETISLTKEHFKIA